MLDDFEMIRARLEGEMRGCGAWLAMEALAGSSYMAPKVALRFYQAQALYLLATRIQICGSL